MSTRYTDRHNHCLGASLDDEMHPGHEGRHGPVRATRSLGKYKQGVTGLQHGNRGLQPANTHIFLIHCNGIHTANKACECLIFEQRLPGHVKNMPWQGSANHGRIYIAGVVGQQ